MLDAVQQNCDEFENVNDVVCDIVNNVVGDIVSNICNRKRKLDNFLFLVTIFYEEGCRGEDCYEMETFDTEKEAQAYMVKKYVEESEFLVNEMKINNKYLYDRYISGTMQFEDIENFKDFIDDDPERGEISWTIEQLSKEVVEKKLKKYVESGGCGDLSDSDNEDRVSF
jgi:hypothetical protein